MVGELRMRPVRTVVGVALAAVLTACGVPIPPELPDTTAPRGGTTTEGEVDRLIPIDARTEELVAALGSLSARIAEARDLLLTSDADARAEAVGVLLGVPEGGTAPGVLPAIEPDRGGTASDDLVTALITLAGDIGGERGRLVLELVRDPMLGDLGAWQRDPVGVVAVLRTIVSDTVGGTGGSRAADTRALDAALLELPGELTRALGYALAVAASEDVALTTHAATQGAGRLGVVLIALEIAIEQLEVPS